MGRHPWAQTMASRDSTHRHRYRKHAKHTASALQRQAGSGAGLVTCNTQEKTSKEDDCMCLPPNCHELCRTLSHWWARQQQYAHFRLHAELVPLFWSGDTSSGLDADILHHKRALPIYIYIYIYMVRSCAGNNLIACMRFMGIMRFPGVLGFSGFLGFS